MSRLRTQDALSALADTYRQAQRNMPWHVLRASGWAQEARDEQGKRPQDAARLGAWLLDRVCKGTPLFVSAADLAQQFEQRGETPAARIAALVRSESGRGFLVGFGAGLGGPLSAPVALPVGILVTWLIQARMVAAIALLWGHALEDPWVRATILLAVDDGRAGLAGDSPKGGESEAWVEVAQKAAGPLLSQLQQRAAQALLRRGSTKRVATWARALPVVGAAVGGGVDAYGCLRVAERAQRLFRPAIKQMPPSTT